MFHCDNSAVVSMIASSSSTNSAVMRVMRSLFYVCARGNFAVTAKHVPGTSNEIADSLSRFQMEEVSLPRTTSSTTTNAAANPTDVELVAHYLQQGLGDNTARTYSSGQHAFIEFCQQRGYLHHNGSPLPTSEFTLMAFAAYLASRRLRPATISVYLASVHSLHIMAGLNNPILKVVYDRGCS